MSDLVVTAIVGSMGIAIGYVVGHLEMISALGARKMNKDRLIEVTVTFKYLQSEIEDDLTLTGRSIPNDDGGYLQAAKRLMAQDCQGGNDYDPKRVKARFIDE